MIKICRFFKCVKAIKIQDALALIKSMVKTNVQKKIKADHKIAMDMFTDHNNIETLFYTNYALKTIKLIIMLVNTSFFLAIFWLIFCELT